MSDRFDFEQQIVKCWSVVDDLKELSAHIIDNNVVGTDTVHNHIFGLACVYDVKFHSLWEMFESVHMNLVRENKMLNEECAALRAQLQESNSDTHGYGIAAIKPKKKDKK
jgi:regulator of replication initiation timing